MKWGHTADQLKQYAAQGPGIDGDIAPSLGKELRRLVERCPSLLFVRKAKVRNFYLEVYLGEIDLLQELKLLRIRQFI